MSARLLGAAVLGARLGRDLLGDLDSRIDASSPASGTASALSRPALLGLLGLAAGLAFRSGRHQRNRHGLGDRRLDQLLGVARLGILGDEPHGGLRRRLGLGFADFGRFGHLGPCFGVGRCLCHRSRHRHVFTPVPSHAYAMGWRRLSARYYDREGRSVFQAAGRDPGDASQAGGCLTVDASSSAPRQPASFEESHSRWQATDLDGRRE